MPRLKPVLISFAAFVVILVVTHAATFPGSLAHLMQVTHGQPILDLKPSFSSAETYQRLQDFGADGRLAYLQTMLTIDTVFPISAFVFLFLLGRYAASRMGLRSGLARMLKALSIAYLALDFLENLTVVVLLINYPDHIDVLAANIGFLSVGKRVSMFAAFGVPLLLLGTVAGVERVRRLLPELRSRSRSRLRSRFH
jgi:hypothetical protein